jgi:undecaprenyl-diphosphatase
VRDTVLTHAHRQSATLYICAALCALLFAVLALAVAGGSTAGFDAAIRNQIHARATGGLTETAQLLSLVGSAKVWVPGLAAALVACWMAGERRRIFGLAIVMGGATLLDNGLKLAFHRVRPEVFFGVLPDTFSFPSGHALFGLCFYGALAAVFASRLRNAGLRIAIWIAAALLIFGIGLSRLYLGMHYPTDVLAGLLAGGAWLSCVCATGLLQRAPRLA